MGASSDVAELISLDDVAEVSVDNETYLECILIEGQTLDRPTELSQLLLEKLKRCPLPRVNVIVDQCVVQIISNGSDRSQVQCSIAEDLTFRGGGRE